MEKETGEASGASQNSDYSQSMFGQANIEEQKADEA